MPSQAAHRPARQRRRARAGLLRVPALAASALALAGLSFAATSAAQAATARPHAARAGTAQAAARTAPRHKPSAAARAAALAAARHDYRRACAAVTTPGRMACNALIRDSVRQRSAASLAPAAAPAGDGYGPSQPAKRLQAAVLDRGQRPDGRGGGRLQRPERRR